MIIGERKVDAHFVAIGRQFVKSRPGAAGQVQRRCTGRGVDDANILHEDAALESGAYGFGECLLRGKALGQRAGDGEGAALGLGLFNLGEDAPDEALAEAVERSLNPLDIAEIGAEPDDHRAASINSRIRRTLASNPTNTASPTR